MTAVLEPQAPEQSMYAEVCDGLQPWPAGPLALDDPAPFHCGAAMTAGPVPIISLGWAPLELGSPEWSCTCGYRMDGVPAGDPLEAVRLASARAESVQWELDAAQEQFENALRNASRLGADQKELGRAAGLTEVELQEFLDGSAPSM